MRWVLDSGEAVGQQHLDVPVATEVAIASELVDVLDALVAEIRDVCVWVVGTEICQNRDWTWCLVVDDRFTNNLATGSDTALVARL